MNIAKIPVSNTLPKENSDNTYPAKKGFSFLKKSARLGPWTLDVLARQQIAKLYQSIDARRTHDGPQAIQFLSSVEGEGVSSISESFANFIATTIGQRVLLIATSPANFGKNEGGALVLQEQFSQEHLATNMFDRMNEASFVKAYIAGDEASETRFVNTHNAAWVIEKFKACVDWIIIDSLPVSKSLASLAFSKCADGVVVVVEADRTRKSQVNATLDLIETSGGTLLGVVFNKQKSYLPKVFRWLGQ